MIRILKYGNKDMQLFPVCTDRRIYMCHEDLPGFQVREDTTMYWKKKKKKKRRGRMSSFVQGEERMSILETTIANNERGN